MITRTKVEKVIGKGFADILDEEVFKVTINWFYTRREMVEKLGCANFIAAAKLAKVLRKLSITTPKKLYELDPSSLARTRGIGAACIFVAMCILDAETYDIIEWWEYEQGNNTVKFSSFKSHVMNRASKRKQEVA